MVATVFGVPFLLGLQAANAALVTSGCANINVSCTLAELASPTASINIDNVVFNNFVGSDFASQIRVTPIDGPGNGENSVAGLRFTPINPANNPWRAAIDPNSNGSNSFLSSIFYSVNVLGGPLLDRVLLSTSFNLGGNLASPSISADIFGPANLIAGCFGGVSVDCVNGTATRQSYFPALDSFFVESAVVGSFNRTGFAGPAFIEMTGIEQAYVRVPEPASLATFAAGLLALGAVRRSRRRSPSTGT